MIYTDKYGFLLNETLDGMDSAMRTGVLGTFGDYWNSWELISIRHSYEISPGTLVRHPIHFPSNNPKNFTRDQMMCLVSTLPPETVRRVFWKCVKRGFFAQNFERDEPGSTKYPWPHWVEESPGVKGLRLFDFADPLLPQHMGHLIVCGKMWFLYPALLISWPLLALSCIFNSDKIDAEQNQLQCMVYRAGKLFVKLYKACSKNWAEQTFYYWDRRNEREYAAAIIKTLRGI